MSQKTYDVVILTASKFLIENPGWYIEQVQKEDLFLQEALEKEGLKVYRTNWDNPTFDWSSCTAVVFRTIWDYFDRYDEFEPWFEKANHKTKMINSYPTIKWNLDKHYLNDLDKKGVEICPTVFVEAGDQRSLEQVLKETSWTDFVIKPVISGGGRHTYKLTLEESPNYEKVYLELIANEAMMIQEFQTHVVSDGEISLVMVDGIYQHAVLKIAKKGDFRVQDDFGGSVHVYTPTKDEIALAEQSIAACDEKPFYGRVDIIKNNDGKNCISELELIEPELWFRNNPLAAEALALAISKSLKS